MEEIRAPDLAAGDAVGVAVVVNHCARAVGGWGDRLSLRGQGAIAQDNTQSQCHQPTQHR